VTPEKRLRKTCDGSIESLSHYTINPAAEKLAGDYPDVAAKLYRAMGFRIINAGRSKYYGAALSNFEQAKKCYEKADLKSLWMETVEKVMNNHARKYSFIPGFKQVVAGKGPSTEPSIIERAKMRWRKLDCFNGVNAARARKANTPQGSNRKRLKCGNHKEQI